MLHHTKDILVRSLPQVIQYRIPLYLPAERLIFNATELILNIKHTEDLGYFDLQKTIKAHKQIEFVVEDLKKPKIELK